MTINEKTLNLFKKINQIPRASGNEKALSDWLVNLAKENSWDVLQDEALNVIIRVPAKNNSNSSQTVILQGHMDMVAVKEDTSNHDFQTDPIDMYEEDGWLKARGTTLGADNGIALAVALAIALDENISHPPLELVFTTDEERGLTGANALKDDVLSGKYLINIDSCIWGTFIIGCAGGRETTITLPLEYCDKTIEDNTFELNIMSLCGGHSGSQIHEGKPNAIHMATRVLNKLSYSGDLHLSSITAGVAHNAIPTNINVIFSHSDENLVMNVTNELFTTFESVYRNYEPSMDLSIKKTNARDKYITKELSQRALQLLHSLPHGVFSTTKGDRKQTETSNNLAQVDIIDDKLWVQLSQRSSLRSQLDFLTDKIHAIANLAGAKASSNAGYPAWEPDWNSELLATAKQSYVNVFSVEPKIMIIHAGLESGVIGAKYPEMEMLSIGVTVHDAHTPSERMNVKDIDEIIRFLSELFKHI